MEKLSVVMMLDKQGFRNGIVFFIGVRTDIIIHKCLFSNRSTSSLDCRLQRNLPDSSRKDENILFSKGILDHGCKNRSTYDISG